ncbi:FecR family protein [Echinicola shivajiensis]|uniref:FecR family protein n=1 Tax=Echinicola shivajiensis TaxID=1035916 RepID=UPI001BFC8741|nr:FecR family protein [Echinicola shivajiensis]
MDRKKQLKAFYKGDLSKDEAADFLQWYHSKEGEEYMSSKLKENWDDQEYANDEVDLWDKEALFRKISRKKWASDYSSQAKQRNIKPDKNWGFKIAASLAVIFTISVLGYQYIMDNQKSPMETLALITKSNPAGQKSKIILPDGTKVYLNAESSISYPSEFKTNRNVELEGEAFFEVFSDKDHPFRVKSKGLSTQALGTAFNIKAYRDSPITEVALTHGKVRVEEISGNRKDELIPGEAIISEGVNNDFRKERIDVETVFLWKEGILHFDETSFEEVVRTLERWYNVKILIEGEYDKDFLCSGTFDKNEYLANVLDILGHSIGFDYQMNKRLIELKFNP